MLALSKNQKNDSSFLEMRRIQEKLNSCLTTLKQESVVLKNQNQQII